MVTLIFIKLVFHKTKSKPLHRVEMHVKCKITLGLCIIVLYKLKKLSHLETIANKIFFFYEFDNDNFIFENINNNNEDLTSTKFRGFGT